MNESNDDIQINANLDWQESTGMQWVNKPVGGIRIKRITDDPGNGGTNIAKTYEYNSGLVVIDTDISSGVLYQNYRYHTLQTFLSGSFMTGTGPPDVCHNIQRFTDNVLPLSMTKGSHIGYEQVLEQWEGGNGSIRYYYETTPKDGIAFSSNGIPALVTTPATSRDYKRGMLIKQITFNQDHDILTEKRFEYTEDFTTDYEFDNIIAYPNPEYVDHPPYSGEGDECYYSYDTYKHVSSWIYLRTETVTNYDQNGANPIFTTTTYKYDNPIHRQPTEVLVENNAGSYTTRTKYPADYGCDATDWLSGTCTDDLSSTDAYAHAILKMKNQLFMHAYPVEVQKLKNGRLIEGTINFYGSSVLLAHN